MMFDPAYERELVLDVALARARRLAELAKWLLNEGCDAVEFRMPLEVLRESWRQAAPDHERGRQVEADDCLTQRLSLAAEALLWANLRSPARRRASGLRVRQALERPNPAPRWRPLCVLVGRWLTTLTAEAPCDGSRSSTAVIAPWAFRQLQRQKQD